LQLSLATLFSTPFRTLQSPLSGGKDSYGNVLLYDVSFEPTGGGLTGSNQDTFCGVLYEYMAHATDTGLPRAPCVTDGNDITENGRIDPPGQGYGVAAVIISRTPVGNTAPFGLNGKNIVGLVDREYEMTTRTPDAVYGNVLAELTFGELFGKVCTSQKTKIRITNNTVDKYAQVAGGPCIQFKAGAGLDLYQGTTVIFYDNATCTTTCGSPIAFNMTVGPNDAGNIDWSGPAATARNGRVRITGACVLGDM
jgi:hypothetical protein